MEGHFREMGLVSATAAAIEKPDHLWTTNLFPLAVYASGASKWSRVSLAEGRTRS